MPPPMLVNNLNPLTALVRPDEAYPVAVVEPDAELSESVVGELFQAISGQAAQIRKG